MKQVKQPINVETGEFPYPLMDGPIESRYLTWIRNHSNYMAERGFIDYFRLVAVLLRGILVNLLTLLPYVLVISVLLGLAYKDLLVDWDKQISTDAPEPGVEFFLFRKSIGASDWVKALQDRMHLKHHHELRFAGDWQEGDTYTTTLTREDEIVPDCVVCQDPGVHGCVTDEANPAQTIAEPACVVTVAGTATTPEILLKRHLAALRQAGGLFDEFRWTQKTDGAGKAHPVIEALAVDHMDARARAESHSIAMTVNSGNFTYQYEPSAPTPYLLTFIVLVLFAAYVLLFPIFTRLFKVVAFKRALATGSSSSVKSRDLFERTFGGLLLALFAVAVIESLPLLVHFFHQFRIADSGWTLPAGLGSVLGLVLANRLLPALAGWIEKLVIVLVGALGLLIPLIVILLVVEFLVYTDPYNGELILGPLLLPTTIGLLIIITAVLGLRSFKAKGFTVLFLLFAAMLALAIVNVLLIIFSEDFGPYWNFVFVLTWAFNIWIFTTLAVDINLTSINGLYRDRLASAFLVGKDTSGDVDIEQDIDLQEICHYDAGSTAPYHLVNVALNLQGSADISIRERNSDFFIFSKRFVGGQRTGYCRSEDMEQVFPQIDLGTAMAISAAAASPNMGRTTNPLMVAFMTLLNVRLGFWVPNPRQLEKQLANGGPNFEPPGFAEVFKEELLEIERRREQAYDGKPPRSLDGRETPALAHNLVGIGFSGGGIRSATINMGIAQALHRHGVFDHIDYMSTVSGGGYLGSSISTLMRFKTSPVSEIDGSVAVEITDDNQKLVRVTAEDSNESRIYRYSTYAELCDNVTSGAKVEAGQPLLKRQLGTGGGRVSLMDRFKWRVRPMSLLREMISKLDEKHKWVNLSDGGHIENLATIELLRRRCRFIIIGDGEADSHLHFNGLATLMRYARIDLGIHIEIGLDKLRLGGSTGKKVRRSEEHFAFGRIHYPGETQCGYLLYLKSSYTGDEEEVITEYRHRKHEFPHESTADQFFDEGQFEAYRSLGQHIAEDALARAPGGGDGHRLSFEELETWFSKNGSPNP